MILRTLLLIVFLGGSPLVAKDRVLFSFDHGDDVMHEIMKEPDELRHEVGRLRDEVSELREKR